MSIVDLNVEVDIDSDEERVLLRTAQDRSISQHPVSWEFETSYLELKVLPGNLGAAPSSVHH
ncbi:uncharacterized protein N7515_002174 [Penicillium bovifimosum]|uniref:Uncharacterized protein n=1 Tax=Penicillium bovifimosum TaxID=126998 RepID=A0A9W9L9G2_9EURO|nr:uncharacterized protein N7515_002174 [Penicillium bovifimosum]KAJ5143387.1 hypothetical protein N7515_002174 [Penicillium bovifimosum]